ncbi:MAG: septation protein SepH, partial [Acidimicrobiales bacterium]
MKKLHLVGVTPDSDGLVLSTRRGARTGSYVVALDDELVASLEQARRRREGDEPVDGPVGAPRPSPAGRPRSSLSPREIQARLRAGSTIAEVAAAARVGEEWVQRFAAPILAEQAQVVERAQAMVFAKARLGPSIEPLAASVRWNLSDRGVRLSDDVFGDCWSAFNLHGTRWAVRFSYVFRKRHQLAEWEVDLREQRLRARNRLAADLAHVEAGRRPPEPEMAEPNAVPAPPPAMPEAVAPSKAPSRTAKAARG